MSQSGSSAMGEMKQGLKKDVDTIRDDLGRLGTDVAGAARGVASAARSGAQQATEYAQETLEDVRRRGEDALESTRETIAQNPWASVGIALGVGVLLGALMRRL